MLLFVFTTRSFTSSDVRTVIQTSDFTVNVWEKIPIWKNQRFDSIFSHFDTSPTRRSLKITEYISNSSIYKIYPILVSLIYIGVLHVCLHFLLPRVQKIKEVGRFKGIIKVVKWWMNKTYLILTFGFYIRNLIMMAPFIFTSSFNEMSTFKNEGTYQVISLLYSVLLILVYVSFICLIIYQAFSKSKIDDQSHNKLGELSSGVKDSIACRLHLAVFLVRRALYLFLLVGLKDLSSQIVIGIITGLQLMYVIYMIILRPYKEVVVNTIEIANEVILFLLILLLNFFNQGDQWNPLITSIYIVIIVLNLTFTIGTSFITALITLVRSIKKCFTKRVNNTRINVGENNEFKVDEKVGDAIL